MAVEVVYQVVGATGSHTVFCERDQVVHCARVTQHIALSPSGVSGGGKGKGRARLHMTQNRMGKGKGVPLAEAERVAFVAVSRGCHLDSWIARPVGSPRS